MGSCTRQVWTVDSCCTRSPADTSRQAENRSFSASSKMSGRGGHAIEPPGVFLCRRRQAETTAEQRLGSRRVLRGGTLPLNRNAVPADAEQRRARAQQPLEQVRTEEQRVSSKSVGIWSKTQPSLSTPPMVVGPPCTLGRTTGAASIGQLGCWMCLVSPRNVQALSCCHCVTTGAVRLSVVC